MVGIELGAIPGFILDRQARKMNPKIVVLTLALAATGCAGGRMLGVIPTSTTPITMQTGKPVPAERIYQAEITAPSPGHTARVYFLRDKGLPGSACTHKIVVDDRAAFDIRAGEYQTLYLAPGPHSFALRIQGGVCPPFTISHSTFLAEGAEETYRICKLRINPAADFPEVEIVDATKGAGRRVWGGLMGSIEKGLYSAPNSVGSPGTELEFAL